VIEPTTPKLTSIKECLVDVGVRANRSHRRLPNLTKERSKSPEMWAMSPKSYEKGVKMMDFDSAQKRWLNETTSTMEVDSNANKRSRSPTIKW
jgi:hypothetical protein